MPAAPGIEASRPRHLPGIEAFSLPSLRRPRSVFRLRFFACTTPRSDFRLRFLTEVGFPTLLFARKTHHRASAERSVSVAVRAAPLTECFLPLTRPAVNPGLGTGLLLSILLWQQDCFNHSCADCRIAPVHYKQLGLGTVLGLVMESAPL